MKQLMILFIPWMLIPSCKNRDDEADAYGNFEADTWTVSAETPGILLNFMPDEGQSLKQGQRVALVDTVQLHLKKEQLKASIEAIKAKLPDVATQIAVYDEQIEKLKTEEKRLIALVENNAAPQKQLDDIQSELEVVQRQKRAALSTLSTQSKSLLAEINPLKFQVMQLDDQIRRSIIRNPVNGKVLTTMVNPNELVQTGMPLYTIAPLDTITLKAYISGDQLSAVKIGDQVQVKVDAQDGEMLTYKGNVSWISEDAEFTPKIIQTKEVRVNQVYATKILVPNDGKLKIGMPAEVYF